MAHSVDMLHIRDYNSMQRLRKHQTIYLRTTGLYSVWRCQLVITHKTALDISMRGLKE